MDVSNIASMYSDVYANAANQSASRLQDKLQNTAKNAATDDELMDACKQFESYFIEQMYKAMVKTIPQNEETSGSTSTTMDYYKDQMLQSIADQTTEQSGFGLAQMLYEQMRRNYGLDAASIQAETEE